MSSPAVDALRHAAPDAYLVLDDDDRIAHVSARLHDDFGRWIGHVLWDHLPGRTRRLRADVRRGARLGPPGGVRGLLLGQGEAPDGDPRARRPRRPRRAARTGGCHDSRDLDSEPGADRGCASWSSVRATRFTSSRVSASSSLSAASSTACAVAASGARTRSLTVVSVISAILRSRASDGAVTPRSQRETVIDSTPSSSASCFWVRPTLRLAVRSRPPTPPPSWVPNLRC